jgi:hypothetical protein
MMEGRVRNVLLVKKGWAKIARVGTGTGTVIGLGNKAIIYNYGANIILLAGLI